MKILSPQQDSLVRIALICLLGLGFLPVTEAQDSKRKKLPYRLFSKRSGDSNRTGEDVKGAPATDDPGIKLGLVSEKAAIPAELKELAQKAAEAITRRKWEEARKLYLEMVEKAPDNALAYANLGVAEYQMKNFVAAEGHLQKSLSINPAIAQNWTTLGLIQYEQGKLLLAISSLSRAIHEAPNSASAHLYLAAVVHEYGWPIAAIEELKRVIELEPENREAHFNLALTYLGLRPPKVELARRHYYRALDLGAVPSVQIERLLKKSLK